MLGGVINAPVATKHRRGDGYVKVGEEAARLNRNTATRCLHQILGLTTRFTLLCAG